jgi:hypothetical protein
MVQYSGQMTADRQRLSHAAHRGPREGCCLTTCPLRGHAPTLPGIETAVCPGLHAVDLDEDLDPLEQVDGLAVAFGWVREIADTHRAFAGRRQRYVSLRRRRWQWPGRRLK